MNRRNFIRLSAAASAAVLCTPRSFADNANASVRITLRPDRLGNKIGDDFIGLSYESAQLGNPHFFSGANTELAGFIRRLGASGVLRIGGNTSEYCYWTPDPANMQSADSLRTGDKANPAAFGMAVGPDTGHKAPAPVNITPLAVRNLRDFLDACGWNLIYGLNMGTGTAEDAADEAAKVMDAAGPKLIAFQLCNEPDLFLSQRNSQVRLRFQTVRRRVAAFFRNHPGASSERSLRRTRHSLQQRMARPLRQTIQARSSVPFAALLRGGPAHRSLHDHRTPAAP
jgi:hypothetical protein